MLAFLPWGLFVPAGMVATGIVLWRTRTTSRWSGGLLALGGVLFVASRPDRIDALAIAADLVLVVALVPIGWAVLTRPGEHTPAASDRTGSDRAGSDRADREGSR